MRIIPIIPLLIFLSCNGNNSVTSKNWASSNELTHRSKRLLEKNVLDSAEILITEAIRLDPTNYEAYNNRAYLKSKLKRPPSEVIADLEKALSLKPDYDIAIFAFPNYYFSIKDYKKAIKYSQKALELPVKREVSEKEVQHIYAIRGESYKYLLEYDNAIADLTKALELDPDDAESYKELADCLYYGRNEISIAIEHYSKAISLKPKYYQAYLGRAHAYENTKPAKKKDALNDYRKAVEINPELKDIYNTNSDLLLMARIEHTQNGG